jgi:xanthine dehydrogenase YagS FAD-binding subunit
LLHELPEFELFQPHTIEEAVETLSSHQGRAKVLAGGTDLLSLMKDRISGPEMPIPEALVDLRKVGGLGSISHSERESVVGSMSTLSEITENKVLSQRFPALVQAAASVGTNQIRNMGTLGGNLCQRPWCWYFRHPAFNCFKKGGKQCFAITGDNSTYFAVYDLGVCVMSHPSDTAPALTSLDASAEIVGPGGKRVVELKDFFLSPRNIRDHVVEDNEILVSVRIPNDGKRSVYLKHRVRNNWDFALASVAASANLEGTSFKSVKVVLGGVAPRPQLIEGLDEFLLEGLTEAAGKKLKARLSERAKPLRLDRYKLRIINALVLRALENLTHPERLTAG